jgi:hypothetical protein
MVRLCVPAFDLVGSGVPERDLGHSLTTKQPRYSSQPHRTVVALCHWPGRKADALVKGKVAGRSV